MNRARLFPARLLAAACLLAAAGCAETPLDTRPFLLPEGSIALSFSVAADMRSYATEDRDYFLGVCERLSYGGAGSFMISPGDIDPPQQVLDRLHGTVGASYLWYPAAGNHEAETAEDMEWLRAFNPGGAALPNIVNPGPSGAVETCYSFDYGPVHFVVLNEYFDGSSDAFTAGEAGGDVSDALWAWLEADLGASSQPLKLVFGHEPAFPQPDEDTGRLRHAEDSLNLYPANRDRFWSTLAAQGVRAYVCGHTHNYSALLQDGVWQIDAGHARGLGDTGSPSTFLMFYVMADETLWCYVYRLDDGSGRYELSGQLRLD